MNELQLSKDLNVITAEINSYKQVAGQSIFEIGRRLNHVKDNDLSHGEFGEWLESIEIERNFATRVMKVSRELGNSKYVTWNNLSQRALYEIATLPEEEREKEHITSNGETKTVDEMTVRELQEVKKKLKQSEQQAEIERKERERLEKELDNVEPQVIERKVVKEVIPEHVSAEIEQLKTLVKTSETSYKSVEKELQQYRMKDVDKFNEEQAEQELKKLRFEAEKGVLRLTVKVNNFLEEIAPYGYMEGEIATSTKSTKEQLEKSLSHLKNFIHNMETSLKGRIEV